MKITRYGLMLLTAVILGFGPATAKAITPTKILDNGPDGQKLVFVVVGDGYAAEDQAKYVNDVNNLVINGVFTHDFYRDNIRAFNVYRLDLVSNASGVSKPGAPKDTALKTIYTGNWSRCWIEESSNTNALLNTALNVIPKYDYVLIIENESDFGGCRRGNRLYVTNGVGWDVVAHEYGHGIGGLFDEYSHSSRPAYTGIEYGPIVNARNCTTVLNAAAVIWSALIANPSLIIPLPTTFNSSMDANETVGIFEGCATYQRGIYRPVNNCRMNTNAPQFCPVCRAIMSGSVARYLGGSPVASASIFGLQNEGSSASSPLFRNHATILNLTQDPQPTGTYLHIVMKVRKNDSPEVVSMTEVQGPLPPRGEAASSSALIVNENNQPPTVEFLPEDPFTIRGFEDPNNRQGEFYAQADSATITVDIPSDISEAASGTVSLELSKVKHFAAANIRQTVGEAALLQQLKSAKKLERQTRLSKSELKTAARDMSKIRSIQ